MRVGAGQRFRRRLDLLASATGVAIDRFSPSRVGFRSNTAMRTSREAAFGTGFDGVVREKAGMVERRALGRRR